MSLVPNVSPRAFTLSAFTVGFLLIDNMTSYEQNALGSWFMLVGQTLCTNSSIHLVNNERRGSMPSSDGNEFNMDTLKRASNIMNEEINKYGK